MIVQINVDELRRIALLSADAAIKMNESNTVISSVVSKHDWKCPERVTIDETLETIKGNSVVLNNAFEEFSSNVFRLANDCSGYINDQLRDDAESEDEVSSIISSLSFGGVTTTVSGGSNTSGVTSSLKTSSMNQANIVSLQGASHQINVMKFSLLQESK